MKILFVAPMPMTPYTGGIERVTDVLARELIRCGHCVYFLCHRTKELVDSPTIAAKQFIISIDLNNAQSAINDYKHLLQEQQIECVIFQWVDAAISVWLKSTPKHIKTICAIHQQPFAINGRERIMIKGFKPQTLRQSLWKYLGLCFPFTHRFFWGSIERNNLRLFNEYADRICLLTTRFIPRVLHFCPGLNADKLVGINDPRTFELPVKVNLSEKENIILFVGRIENAQKNVLGFVDVWNLVSAKNPDWKAVVVGDGNDLPDVKHYAEKLNVERIEFVGQQKDVAMYYERAKILLVTSFWEGFSMVLVEAMSYGCVPCVFDSYEALYDIVDDEKNGFICPSFIIEEMASRVQSLIDDNVLCVRMANEAMMKSDKFNVTKIASQWVELIGSIRVD